jgi:hypothetical protein
LIEQSADADQFLFHERDFARLGSLLRGEAGDLLVELRDALAELLLLADAAGRAHIEQLRFAGDDVLHVVICDLFDKLRWKRNTIDAALLGFQPRRTGPQSVEVLGDDGKAGFGDGIVQAHDDIAGLYQVAVAGAHFADDAAGRVLDFLDVGIDDHRAGRDQGAGDLRGRCPAAQTACEHEHNDEADNEVDSDRAARSCERRFAPPSHGLATPPSATILIGCGAGRCST